MCFHWTIVDKRRLNSSNKKKLTVFIQWDKKHKSYTNSTLSGPSGTEIKWLSTKVRSVKGLHFHRAVTFNRRHLKENITLLHRRLVKNVKRTSNLHILIVTVTPGLFCGILNSCVLLKGNGSVFDRWISELKETPESKHLRYTLNQTMKLKKMQDKCLKWFKVHSTLWT